MKTYELTPLSKPLVQSISVPGSKSYTNRALILAALTKGTVTIKIPLFSDDTKAMISCLQSLGIAIEIKDDEIIVSGDISRIKDQEFTLNAHLSGTTIRFITALSCLIPGIKLITGEEGLNKRPIEPLIDSLKQLGAEITYQENDGYPPINISSSNLKGGITEIRGDVSSQYLSALLMIAPVIGDITIHVTGEQISKPYIDMTIASMKNFGVSVINNNYQQYKIVEQQYKAHEYVVEGDYSSAGYFFAIAALTKSTITVENLHPDSVQADKELLTILKDMGNQVAFSDNTVTIIGNQIKPVTVSMQSYPDQAQTLAVLAAFANGRTEIRGIKSLRIKETERIKALESELGKMGIKTESTEDSLVIYGGNPKPAVIETYGDHRMAMAFAIAGSKLPEMKINNPDVVTKTFPSFWEKVEKVGIGVKEV